MVHSSPRLPTRDEWIDRGVHVGVELHAGKQSRVFAATVDGQSVAVKLTDGALALPDLVTERARVVEALAGLIDEVAAPIRFDGELVHPLGDWLMTATPFVGGRHLDIVERADADMMGRTLARMHEALTLLPTFDVPTVAALDVTGADTSSTGWQLLHGDFSDQNAIVTPTGLRVFDFDECGYGPVAYDLANSLYMVLFDATVTSRPSRYESFRPVFLDGYGDAAGSSVDESAVDSMIDTRVDALDRWLDDLPNAPIGIRTSPPEWHDTLRGFLSAYRPSA